MSDFKERLKIEREELVDKHVKLCEFLASNACDNLSLGNRKLLSMQVHIMSDYIDVLDVRIELLSV